MRHLSTTILAVCAVFVSVLAVLQPQPARAAEEERQIAQLDKWRVGAVFLNGSYLYCYADLDNATATLRLANVSGNWVMGTPYYGSDRPSGYVKVAPFVFPQAPHPLVQFNTTGTGWAFVDLDPAALKDGSNAMVNITMGASPSDIGRGAQIWSLGRAASVATALRVCNKTKGKTIFEFNFGGAPGGGAQAQPTSPAPGGTRQGNSSFFPSQPAQTSPLQITGLRIGAGEYNVGTYRFQGRGNRRTGRCQIIWGGRTIFDDTCTIEDRGGPGSMEIFGGGIQGKVYAYNPGEGNGGDGFGAVKTNKIDHFLGTGELYRSGNCWENSSNKICTW